MNWWQFVFCLDKKHLSGLKDVKSKQHDYKHPITISWNCKNKVPLISSMALVYEDVTQLPSWDYCPYLSWVIHAGWEFKVVCSIWKSAGGSQLDSGLNFIICLIADNFFFNRSQPQLCVQWAIVINEFYHPHLSTACVHYVISFKSNYCTEALNGHDSNKTRILGYREKTKGRFLFLLIMFASNQLTVNASERPRSSPAY